MIGWYGLSEVLRTFVRKTSSLLFTSICPPRKILMLWSLKISPCILKCSGIFKLSDIFEFSLLPVSWLADFSRFSSTIKDGYYSSVEHVTIFSQQTYPNCLLRYQANCLQGFSNRFLNSKSFCRWFIGYKWVKHIIYNMSHIICDI